MQEMKQTINEEMKDMRSANKQFQYEIERNQGLYRALHQELMLTLEEKKTQNNAILDNAKEATEAEKKAKKRAGSVSVQNNGAFSLQTLLP